MSEQKRGRRQRAEWEASGLEERVGETEQAGELSEVYRDVAAGGVRMRTTEWSRAPSSHAEYPIVALPGVLAPRQSFRRLAAHLPSAFRLIAVDFPGFGESEKPSPNRYAYGVKAFAEGIADLFGGMGLSRAHVLGHGLGGSVAVTLAARHPELVARLALIGPLAQPGRASVGLQALLAPLVGGLLFRQLLGKRTFARLYQDRVNPLAEEAELETYYQALAPPSARAALLATLRASLDTRSVIADSRRVRAPTLLIWGLDDKLLPVKVGRHLNREMPQAGLELLPSSHAPHEQLPERVGEILGRFFDGQRPGLS